MSFLFEPAPVWVVFAVALVVAVPLFWCQRKLAIRVNHHAESIGNMDEWADVVEDKFQELDRDARTNRLNVAAVNNNFVREMVQGMSRR